MSSAGSYYDEKLSAERLRRCYEIAPPRVKQYLQAEIEHVLSHIKPDDMILELGCGYGRVLKHLAGKARIAVGVDISYASLKMAMEHLRRLESYFLFQMNALETGFKDDTYDLVCCIQNGISAFKVDNIKLLNEAVRITRTGGLVLFSTYSHDFWQYRLKWFEIQAEEGLLGEVDYEKTGNGEIVCKDGFKATTYNPSYLKEIADRLNLKSSITEIDSSSVFLEIYV